MKVGVLAWILADRFYQLVIYCDSIWFYCVIYCDILPFFGGKIWIYYLISCLCRTIDVHFDGKSGILQ